MANGGVDFDVVIIGGGPAGSAMASYLARAGVTCCVLERELFPRPHVGESLVPSSTRIFNDLGLWEKLEDAGFPKKYGAVWTAAHSERRYSHDFLGVEEFADVRFAEREQPGVDKPYTFHVDRGKFDLLLLQHANELGAAVYEGVSVRGVAFDQGGGTARVTFKMGPKEFDLATHVVVDASGRRTLVGSQLGWKVKDPKFDQYALHTWFENYDRAIVGEEGKEDFIYIHFLPIANGWVWQIPITDDITSIGVVTQKEAFARRRSEQDEWFWDCVGSRPEFCAALRKATQVRPFRSEGDYSYAMSQITGDRVVLIGDAARFVDPIFSTGVSIALNSARFAAPDVLAALESGDFSRQAFGEYERTISRGTKNWYDFISVYYRLNVLFTAFVRDERYRLDVLKLLQGDVYDEETPEVLGRMQEIVASVENNPDHVWHQLLNDLTADAFKPAF